MKLDDCTEKQIESLARRPDTPKDILYNLCLGSDGKILEILTRNAGTPEEGLYALADKADAAHLHRLIYHRHSSKRIVLHLSNKKIPSLLPDILTLQNLDRDIFISLLSNYKDEYHKISKHSQFPDELLDLMGLRNWEERFLSKKGDWDDVDIRKAVESPRPDVAKHLLKHFKLDESSVLKIFDRFGDDIWPWIMRHQSIPKSLQDNIENLKDIECLEELLLNPNIDSEIVSRLVETPKLWLWYSNNLPRRDINYRKYYSSFDPAAFDSILEKLLNIDHKKLSRKSQFMVDIYSAYAASSFEGNIFDYIVSNTHDHEMIELALKFPLRPSTYAHLIKNTDLKDITEKLICYWIISTENRDLDLIFGRTDDRFLDWKSTPSAQYITEDFKEWLCHLEGIWSELIGYYGGFIGLMNNPLCHEKIHYYGKNHEFYRIKSALSLSCPTRFLDELVKSEDTVVAYAAKTTLEKKMDITIRQIENADIQHKESFDAECESLANDANLERGTASFEDFDDY